MTQQTTQQQPGTQVSPEQYQQQQPGQRVDFQSLVDAGVGTPWTGTSPTGGQSEVIQQFSQAYFQQAEETLRQARRVSEILAIAYTKQEIVQQIKSEVMRELAPLLASVVREQQSARHAMSSSGSGSGSSPQR